ncbi:MAG: 30S ribosomal protein S4 [Nitrospirae bacterium GWC2_57_9]|nr:MAG: 30S ribosomal protein S4 [Nitrospirae bacterium GWC2_57_9]
MARLSKHKISRRFGVDIYGTGGTSLQRRINVPPGGMKNPRQRKSEYVRQLAEKQKVKYMYGVREAQFLRYFEKALRSNEPSGQVLLQTLERRLDNALYRFGFARTRLMGRHLISYGHVLIDGRRVDKPSYLVSPGESITVTEQALKIPEVQDELKAHRNPVAWLTREGTTGKVIGLPNRDEVGMEIDESLIVEFYSR